MLSPRCSRWEAKRNKLGVGQGQAEGRATAVPRRAMGAAGRLRRQIMIHTCRIYSPGLYGYGLRAYLPHHPASSASSPVSVRQVVALSHACFSPRLTSTPWRAAPSGWGENFHLQAALHARRTTKKRPVATGLSWSTCPNSLLDLSDPAAPTAGGRCRRRGASLWAHSRP